MADFNSDFWNWYITIISIISILACYLADTLDVGGL